MSTARARSPGPVGAILSPTGRREKANAGAGGVEGVGGGERKAESRRQKAKSRDSPDQRSLAPRAIFRSPPSALRLPLSAFRPPPSALRLLLSAFCSLLCALRLPPFRPPTSPS